MILCLDIGNSRLKAGLFASDRLVARFEHDTARLLKPRDWVDWLRAELNQQTLAGQTVSAVHSCCVVPDLESGLKAGCVALFGEAPFMLRADNQRTLELDYRDPRELGPDRIAAAIGACRRWPGERLIVVGCGTALTFCCIDEQRRHRGGAITAGPGLVARALHSGTGRLPEVTFEAQPPVLGHSTRSSIQSGLFYGLIGQVRELSARLSAQCFAGQTARLIGTGGYAVALRATNLFDDIEPNLVLHGLSATQS